jgi:hypothetical protein
MKLVELLKSKYLDDKYLTFKEPIPAPKNKGQVFTKEIKILADSWETSLLQKVPTLPYAKVTDKVWDTIQDEGLDEEFEVSRQDFSYANLPISEDISHDLKQFGDEIIERFNAFDIALKNKYGKKYTDIIDYDLGRVLIVRVDSF